MCIRDRGKNMLTLMSLDSIVTDEIYVDELEVASAPGKCGLMLGTRRHEWHLSMSESERTNWLNWLYALNPWLTPNLSLIHISEPTRLLSISYAVFCLKKKKKLKYKTECIRHTRRW
eukprot:TRINITY_DN23401_c0_g1_i1.p2 TRINITY_DN23401_c0_g1~~TRINITY_DN23401_c0_g1_i1.p2  ORF type:complete len:117 (+),score=21.67 TRINITY_DN23401_c0_g1_i1:168-518(+)